jgi:hypothetical protein
MHNNSSKVGQKDLDDQDLDEVEDIHLQEVFQTDDEINHHIKRGTV